jgi:FkbM family methyltransferase
MKPFFVIARANMRTPFKILWKLLLPLRLYLKYFPLQQGKGILLRRVVFPILPDKQASFLTTLVGGGKIILQYRETLGWSTLLYGPFEGIELDYVAKIVQPGDTVFDIGANIGLYSIVLGTSVGEAGQVIAVEPIRSNADRIKQNLELNSLKNCQIITSAVGASAGEITLNLSHDPAYHSVGEVSEDRGNGSSVNVKIIRLDDIWKDLGSPKVRFVKIDVEGLESDVLIGAMDLLKHSFPVLLLEANDEASLNRLSNVIEPIGYCFSQPKGFALHNYLATHGGGILPTATLF